MTTFASAVEPKERIGSLESTLAPITRASVVGMGSAIGARGLPNAAARAMTTNQNEPGAPDGWNYGSGDCLNPACATYGGQGTFKRRKGSTDPRVCSTCSQPERGSIETNGSFKPATNGHHVAPPSADMVALAEKVVAQHKARCGLCGAHESAQPMARIDGEVRCFDVFGCKERRQAWATRLAADSAAAGEAEYGKRDTEPAPAPDHAPALSALPAARPRPWEPPAVLPGASTVMAEELRQAKTRIAELEKRHDAWCDGCYKGGVTDGAMKAGRAAAAAALAFAEKLERVENALADSQRWRLAAEGSLEVVNEQLLSANSDLAETATERDAARLERDTLIELHNRTSDHLTSARAELGAVREQLRKVYEYAIYIGGGSDRDAPVMRDARAALDSTAPAPRPAIEALINERKACPACGKPSRATTAGCDHCDLEDK